MYAEHWTLVDIRVLPMLSWMPVVNDACEDGDMLQGEDQYVGLLPDTVHNKVLKSATQEAEGSFCVGGLL